jgi:hypothetical protein
MVLKASFLAQPSSRLMVAVSKVSACHISNWLMAVLGRKLQPTSHPCWAYHVLAFSIVHCACGDTDVLSAGGIIKESFSIIFPIMQACVNVILVKDSAAM